MASEFGGVYSERVGSYWYLRCFLHSEDQGEAGFFSDRISIFIRLSYMTLLS